MRNKPKLLLLLFVFITVKSFAQDENLLKGVEDTTPKKEYVYNAFKSTRVIMSQSMEMLRPGVLNMLILHRFGPVSGGLYEFFGLDAASFRLGLDYGITNNLMIGIGRSTFQKELDGFIKYRLIQQATGPNSLPFSLIAVAGSTLITEEPDQTRENFFSSRVAYYGQLIIGRKFSESFTLQLMPTMLHRNMVTTVKDPNDLYAAGIGARIKLSKRISFNVDYHYVINQNKDSIWHNPLSIGFDIETGGHVFQLHFTNAKGMNERTFLSATDNEWGKGEVSLGFNITRAFQVRKKKG